MKDIAVNGTRYQLKQCEVIRLEDEFGHSYMINEEPVAGVTTLLSMGMPVEQGLLEYFKRTDKEAQEDILIDAQERGSNVHHAIERLLLGKEVESEQLRRKREKFGVAAFVDFFDKVQPTDIISEQVIAYLGNTGNYADMDTFASSMRFAGTLDFIGTINGKRILIDFKTSTAHSRKNELQVEAYKEAVQQSHDEKIDYCYILYLGTGHKGSRSIIDANGLPSTGLGWSLVQSKATFSDFCLAYNMALFMNSGQYPKPPKTVVFPEKWKILEPKKETR